MNEELGILLSSGIDINKSVQAINKDLKTITKQLQTLELNVDLGKAQRDIQEFNKNIQKSMGSAGSSNVGQKITDSVSINMDSLRKNHREAFNEIDKLLKHYGGSVSSIRKSGGLDITDNGKVTEQLNKYNVAMKDLNGVVRNFEIRNMADGLEIVDFNEITNVEKAMKNQEKLADSMARGREQSMERQRKEQEKLAQTQARFSNKAIDDAHKEALAEKKKTDELAHQIKLAQQQAAINVQNFKRRYNPVITPEQNQQLDDYVASMNRLTTITPNVSRSIKDLNMGFKQTSASVQDAGAKVDSFGKQMMVAMQRIPIWIKPIVQVKLL
ncbi:hypothetical protein [Oceanobacillus sp. FSL H7-0719]|uniref:hypothetical protein n=1 Tax=Oceanobacillus sp. FSL H7-0719 TaxID=2954507 RepID=UPI00324AB01B